MCLKLNKDKIFKYIKEILQFDDSLNEKYKELIDIAEEDIKSKLKKDVNKNSHILNMLCTYLVNYWIILENCANSTSGRFSGNGYTIYKNTKTEYENALNLLNHWRAKAANLIVDTEFSVSAIKGN